MRRRADLALVVTVIMNVLSPSVGAAATPVAAFITVDPDDFLNADIRILYLDGSVSDRIQPDAIRPMDLAISPDGKEIAFSTWGPVCVATQCRPVAPALYAMNVDGSGLQRVFAAEESINVLHGLDWSPDGTKILFEQRPFPDADGARANLDVSVVTRSLPGVWSQPEGLLERPGNEEAAEWSPDGKHVVYSYDPNPSGTYDYEAGDEVVSAIWMSDSDGSGPHVRLTPRSGFRSSPTISPDGRSIAYVMATSMWSRKDWQIRVINIQRRDERVVAVGRYESWNPDFAPDGSKLLVSEGYGLAAGRLVEFSLHGRPRSRVLYDSPNFDTDAAFFPVP